MSDRRIESKSRKTVWHLKPDAEGYYLIIRRIEDWQYVKCYRAELQRDHLPQYVPYSTATICGQQIIDVTTPEWCRERGHAKRLVLLAKMTVFPKLFLSQPVTWRGRRLYQALVALHPDMIDPTYDTNQDMKLAEQENFEKSFVFSPEYAESLNHHS